MKKKKIQDFRRSINLKLNENLVGLNAGKMAYNFAFSGGSLRGECPFQAFFDRYFGSLGEFEQILNPDMVLAGGVCVYYEKTDENAGTRADKLVVVDKNNKVFYLNLYDAEPKFIDLNLKFTSKPTAFCYNHYGDDCLVFCSKTDNMVVWDGENDAYFVENSPKITSMTMHYERLFATTSTDKYTLYFSDDLDPTNWNENITEGGFIQMLDERGELLKVISFLGYVYVFREHGISRVTAYADQTQFAVTHLFTASGKIFADTVALCGDKVMFACEDGIYVFDGLSARKVLSNLDGFIKSDSHSTAIFYEGKYYLSLRVDYDGKVGCENGEYINNVVLIYGDGYEIVRGYDIRKFCAGDELYAISGTSVLKIGTNGLQKCWESPVVDLGSSKRKRVLWLYLDTCCDVTVTFFGDGIQKSVTVSGSATAQRVRVDMTCRKFGLRIVSIDDAPKVSRPQIYYRYTE